MHGNRLPDICKVQVAEAQEHSPQSLRTESSFAKIHEESAVEPASGKERKYAQKKLLFFGKSRKRKELSHLAVNIRSPSIDARRFVSDLRISSAAHLSQDLLDSTEPRTILEGCSNQFDDHDMLADGEYDLLHHHLLGFRPFVVIIDLSGKLCQLRPRQEVFPGGKADRRILGRHKESRSEKDVCTGPAEQIEDVPVCPLLRICLTDPCEHLKKGPVILFRIKIVDKQEQTRSISRNPGEVKFKQFFL